MNGGGRGGGGSYPLCDQAPAPLLGGRGIEGQELPKTARGVGVQLMSVLGDSKDTIRQQCAKFDSAPSPNS